jgi:hypothetical protein
VARKESTSITTRHVVYRDPAGPAARNCQSILIVLIAVGHLEKRRSAAHRSWYATGARVVTSVGVEVLCCAGVGVELGFAVRAVPEVEQRNWLPTGLLNLKADVVQSEDLWASAAPGTG